VRSVGLFVYTFIFGICFGVLDWWGAFCIYFVGVDIG
jgi:hypothetical protein